MCSRYHVKIQEKELEELQGVAAPDDVSNLSGDFLPHKKAPVIVQGKDKELKFFPMNFSLIPSWSKDPKVKFATHNARIETVTEKPTWRKPFYSQHCLVPMTGFYESAYEGPLAGNIIEFSKPDQKLLFAAGIWDRWIDPLKQTPDIFSFAILTTTPTDFIQHYGHDRSPIFLDFEHGKKWLGESGNEKAQIEFLNRSLIRPELSVKVERPLKAGWEKRK